MSTETDRVTAWGAELRRVHDRLREALDVARDAVADADDDAAGAPPTAARDLLLFCHGSCAALDGHHRAEDGALFPQLVRERPDLAPVIEQLTRDHSMIAHLVGAFGASLRSGAGGPVLLRHLDGLDAVMESHFRYEERTLVQHLDALGEIAGSRQDVYGPLA